MGLEMRVKSVLCDGLLCVTYRRWTGPCEVSGKQNESCPLKELSIARLELMSARILAQLMNTTCNALQSQLKTDTLRFWLDSKTALGFKIRENGNSSCGTE